MSMHFWPGFGLAPLPLYFTSTDFKYDLRLWIDHADPFRQGMIHAEIIDRLALEYDMNIEQLQAHARTVLALLILKESLLENQTD